MNFHDAQTGRVLKQHYERLLLVYDVHESGIYADETDQSTVKKQQPSKRVMVANYSILLKNQYYLVDSNGPIKNGTKRRATPSSSNANSGDPVRTNGRNLFSF